MICSTDLAGAAKTVNMTALPSISVNHRAVCLLLLSESGQSNLKMLKTVPKKSAFFSGERRKFTKTCLPARCDRLEKNSAKDDAALHCGNALQQQWSPADDRCSLSCTDVSSDADCYLRPSAS